MFDLYKYSFKLRGGFKDAQSIKNFWYVERNTYTVSGDQIFALMQKLSGERLNAQMQEIEEFLDKRI